MWELGELLLPLVYDVAHVFFFYSTGCKYKDKMGGMVKMCAVGVGKVVDFRRIVFVMHAKNQFNIKKRHQTTTTTTTTAAAADNICTCLCVRIGMAYSREWSG